MKKLKDHKNFHIYNVPPALHSELHIIKSAIPGATINQVILFALQKFVEDVKRKKELGNDISSLLLYRGRMEDLEGTF